MAAWQAGDWLLRFVTIWFFLGAFGIEQSVRNVLLVQVTQSLATLVPISPGGIGTEQAFIVFVFKGTVARSALLAFSVGMKLTLTVVNATVGFTALFLILGHVRWRDVIGQRPAPER
ncbi:MAG: flippase-like domain-containing protein [Actinobacteria bacterium]|nr:flippase-like domain-containing protein [Actinomycetota bacterium]